MTRERVPSASSYAPVIGFSRAIRVGDRVLVSGTAPVLPDGSCHDEPEAQARRCLEIILDALKQLGASPNDVVRTRTYLVDADDWEAVGRAHAHAFGEALPASTMVVVAGASSTVVGRSRSRPRPLCRGTSPKPGRQPFLIRYL